MGLTGQLFGSLIVADGCVWVAYWAERYLVVWPSAYVPGRYEGRLVILDQDRSVVAREGEHIALGGGEVALNRQGAQIAVRELTGTEIPSTCDAQLVWNANSVIPSDR